MRICPSPLRSSGSGFWINWNPAPLFITFPSPFASRVNWMSRRSANALRDCQAARSIAHYVCQQGRTRRAGYFARRPDPHGDHRPLQLLPLMSVKNEVEELVAREYQQPFDLVRQWPLRAKLLRLERRGTYRPAYDAPCCERWLVSRCAGPGGSGPLRSLPSGRTFTACRACQFSMPTLPHGNVSGFRAKQLEKQLNYWREQLLGAPPVLELPTDWPRPAVQTIHGNTLSHIAEDLSTRRSRS